MHSRPVGGSVVTIHLSLFMFFFSFLHKGAFFIVGLSNPVENLEVIIHSNYYQVPPTIHCHTKIAHMVEMYSCIH